ncbi:hypothetical protein ACWCXB_28150 [Streptomyces sp. NPDC001514]
MEQQLMALAEDSPVAALEAVAALERITCRIGRQAACNAQSDAEADELPLETAARRRSAETFAFRAMTG